ETKKKVGRPRFLGDEHKTFLSTLYIYQPFTTVGEAIGTLTSEFEGISIQTTAVTNFLKKELQLTFKRVIFHPEEHNSSRTIAKRFKNGFPKARLTLQIVSILTNCVFIHEASFNINLRLLIGYLYVYLPPYSHELNSIKLFWAEINYLVRRDRLEKT
ncbi:hypothetical protein DM01DRAFT_1296692, partial [Hesseltinella vesiculosa]